MSHKKRTLSLIGVWLSFLWLAACSSTPATSTPTVDMDPFRTQVAATVLAQVTQALALTPSATSLPSPSATSLPTLTPYLTASPSPSVAVIRSSGTATAVTVNQAQWVAQSIADGTVFTPGQTFTMIWTLKNSGTSTWTAAYLLRFYSGQSFGAPKEISIGRQVLPGDQIEISLQMKAPTTTGSYQSNWVMSTENRSNFKEPVYLNIKVATAVTPSPTP